MSKRTASNNYATLGVGSRGNKKAVKFTLSGLFAPTEKDFCYSVSSPPKPTQQVTKAKSQDQTFVNNLEPCQKREYFSLKVPEEATIIGLEDNLALDGLRCRHPRDGDSKGGYVLANKSQTDPAGRKNGSGLNNLS